MSLKEVVKELKELIGEEWVSDHPADLTVYARDFTIVSGCTPDIVVLPKTTQDVQGVIKTANKYKTPIVPLSTGFNHGGLAIPMRGGILVDLRRMNELLEIDEESMTATIQPHVRCRSLWVESLKRATAGGLKLKPALPITFSSVSVLANYVSRGGSAWIVKYGWNAELIINMTWVLPNGEILKTGPSGIPLVGNVPVQYGPGPDIAGMFINADGNFGICTEMTIKLFPEKDYEKLYFATSFEPDDKACEQVVNTIYDLAQEDICGFLYKTHHGSMAVQAGGFAGADPVDLSEAVPKHVLIVILQGLTQEELDIKERIITEIVEGNGLIFYDPATMGLGAIATTVPFKKAWEVTNNLICAYRGSFQFLAGVVKLEKTPELYKEYKELVVRYWKDPGERALSGFSIQGPSPFARTGTFELDWWWDQGNPESVKLATEMVRKTGELLIKNGLPLFRNMHGLGEIHLPRWDVYYDILKELKHVMDPENIMHPGVIPIGKGYV